MPKAKPKKQTPRITAAEKEARVNRIYELLLSGATRFQILQYASMEKEQKKDWNITNRQVDSYIQEANAMIAIEAEYHRPREFGRALGSLNDLYQKCMKVMDYQRALAVRREINALLSLYEPPAERTLKILGVQENQLAELISALKQHGQNPSDLFNALIQELAQTDATNSTD